MFPALEEDKDDEDVNPLLPSTCTETLQSPEGEAWAKAELMIRVGIGHDTLQRIRIAAGLHNYYLRHQKHSRGREQMLRVAKSQDSESKKKAKLVSCYIENWNKIEMLLNSYPRLRTQKKRIIKGLQSLNRSEDVKFFQEWGSQTQNYVEHSGQSVSWIWTVCMEEQGAPLTEKSEIKKLTGTWESEGNYIECTHSQDSNAQLARRLEWLHCYTRNERWKEEVLLTAEEIRRLGEWHLYRVQHSKCIAQVTDQLDNSWISRGFKFMLQSRVAIAQAEYNALPHMVKVGVLQVNLDAVV